MKSSRYGGIFMKLRKEDLLVSIFKFTEEIFHIYCQHKDMAHFHNLQDKLEALTSMVVGYQQ